VHKISIIPRGIGALGYTIQRPTDDRYLMTRTELESKMTVLLGGRAAEHLVFDHLSTGAADDLAKATDIARSMATQYGMFPELGHVSYEQPGQRFLGPDMLAQRRAYSESTAREIDSAVRQSVDGAFVRAKEILARNRAVLERGAEQLLAQETLDEAALRVLFAEVVSVTGDKGGQVTPAAAQ
jgi:cell division protease FtsH